MTSIGAANGPRGSSLKLRPPEGMLRLSQRSLRLCGEVVVLSILRCTESIDATQSAAVSGAPRRTITRHRVPSKLSANSLKTNDGRTREVSQELRPAFRDRASEVDLRFSNFPLPSRQIKCNTVALNFQRNSLKTNDGHPHKAKHFFDDQISNSPISISRTRAVLQSSNFEFRVSTPIPESRAAAIPGFLTTSHSSLATLLSGGMI